MFRLRLALVATFVVLPAAGHAQARPQAEWPLPPLKTQKPPLHAKHWLAITGKPLSATAGAMMFQKGGNAVDAAAAMLAAGCTIWDTLSCGGETQALIYDPRQKKVIGINALGVAPSGATPEYYRSRGYRYPPEYGPLAAVTPGTPGGLMTMLAEYGTLSLKDVLGPAIQLADGYPIEAQLARTIEQYRDTIKQWKVAPSIMLPHRGENWEAPQPGEIFVQKDLAATWRKLVEAEQQALRAGKTRKQAIYAAYDRFYKGDIAREIVRGTRDDGGLFTMEDLATWKVRIEEPVSTTYKGITVYKLPFWQQGPAMLQALNILEGVDLKSMGYNSPRYINTVYQTLSLAFADRDFYYGDPYVAPEEPAKGLLSKAYAKTRLAQLSWDRNDPNVKPGDPYPFQGGQNPFTDLLARWTVVPAPDTLKRSGQQDKPVPNDSAFFDSFYAGTTSIEAADSAGWVVSVTPSGGWVPAVIAGRTGVGLSQRAQSFVTDATDGPFNVIAPGKHPRVTLTPTLALKDGAPYLAFAVQGGDSQDQNLLQFFLNVVEWGMTPQQAVEAPNINSYQMRSSFGAHESRPGRILVASSTPQSVRDALVQMGYTLEVEARTSGPINAILFDRAHRSMWGGSSNHGEDYGIAW
ncbi:gamma-glutamyltranspeptidase [Gemmatirosa kalamazoonensis]|uniref:Gamma-glutamyltranspeptidase n=1 Tax=Gemmatirosa kalamazoonensis TaxID=861299 RepID=W0RAI4_9BACT|nr:gamma-glutamyltransferase [Gemmatirosa kalamazoonensis]AHG87791.1 gamma-glutamyltranspeptidase [Gemmatirosa kalamazoonensis]